MKLLHESLLPEEAESLFLPLLFKEIPVAISVSEKLTDSSFVFLAVNDYYCKFTGFNRDELIGHDTAITEALIPPEYLENIRDTLACGQSVTNLEVPWRQKDGSSNWALISIRILIVSGKTLLVGIATDISQQKYIEKELAGKYEELQATYEELVAMEETLNAQNQELKEADAKLALSEERFRLAMESSETGLMDSDLLQPGEPFWLSRNWLERLGFDNLPLPICQEPFIQRVHPEDHLIIDKAYKELWRGERPLFEAEYRLLDRYGQWIWVLVRGQLIRNAAGQPIRWIGTIADISDLKNREMERYYQATHDELTGLLNRRGFMESITAYCQDVSTAQGACLALDIDGFRFINDVHGQVVGDEYLRSFADYLKRIFPDGTTLSRPGADEYLAFFPGETGAVAVLNCCHLLRNVALQTSSGLFTAHVSGGIFLLETEYGTPESFVQKAMLAMHHAKATGKSTFHIFDPSMHEQANRRHAIQEGLNQALIKQEIFLVYQPIFDICEIPERIIGYEVLLRWSSPVLGVVSPAEFIPVAEEINLIHPIGEWVMREACRFASEMQQAGSSINIAVNVSVRQLIAPGFIDMVKSILKDSGLPAQCLAIEVTESIMMSNEAKNIQVLNDLRNAGVSISLDDFGTGYSSFTYLQKLPLNTLKIDKTLIDEITVPESNALLLMESLVQMSRLLGYRIVAEGVEKKEQLLLLRQIGCEACQGYLLGRPVPQSSLKLEHS